VHNLDYRSTFQHSETVAHLWNLAMTDAELASAKETWFWRDTGTGLLRKQSTLSSCKWLLQWVRPVDGH